MDFLAPAPREKLPLAATKIDAPISQGGSGIVMVPTGGSYSKVIVWLHGLADTPDSFIPHLNQLGFENTKIILPLAPQRSVAIYGGTVITAWANVFGMDAKSPEDKQGIEESAGRVAKLIQAEIDSGIAPNRIVIVGFSQGGAIALHVALRFPFPLGGCVALSTWLPLRNEYPTAMSQGARAVKILQIHGTADQMVPYSFGMVTHNILRTFIPSPTPKFMTADGGGHAVDQSAYAAIKFFIEDDVGFQFMSTMSV